MSKEEAGKRSLGQYFTTRDIWLKENVKNFIRNSHCSVAYDPFAGSGELLNVTSRLGLKPVGLDIDPKLNWALNDSLMKIPHVEDAIIVTNPPYLSNYSAKRRGILHEVEQYFAITNYDDLYLLALRNMLEAQDHVVAIVPETFIGSPFQEKNRLFSINILEENPFGDTETPVCVACFDNKFKSPDGIQVYKNSHFVSNLGKIERLALKPNNNIGIKFNSLDGEIALRAIDTTNPRKKIAFMRKNELDYDLSGIKESSRLITVIDVKIDPKRVDDFIIACNKILSRYRRQTDDILLSPFKGNMKDGVRRRRLDFETARAIMEKALTRVKS